MSAGFLILVASLVLTQPAAPSAADEVQHGVQRYGELDYRGAAMAFKGALESESLSLPDRVKALSYLARTQAVLERPRRAIKTFIRLLKLDPTFRIPWEESPRIQEAFSEARKYSKADAPEEGTSTASKTASDPGDLGPKSKSKKGKRTRGPRRGARAQRKEQAPIRDSEPLLAALPSGNPGDGEAVSLTEVDAARPFWADLPEWVWPAAVAVVATGLGATVVILSARQTQELPEDAVRWQLP